MWEMITMAGTARVPGSAAFFPTYVVIPGKFLIVGYEPDGDSVRFAADDPAQYSHLRRSNLIHLSPTDGSVQLRFEGIDATELHYGGRRAAAWSRGMRCPVEGYRTCQLEARCWLGKQGGERESNVDCRRNPLDRSGCPRPSNLLCLARAGPAQWFEHCRR